MADLRSLHISVGGVAFAVVVVVTQVLMMTVIFLGEEIGWRGYMLPRVHQLTSNRGGPR